MNKTKLTAYQLTASIHTLAVRSSGVVEGIED